MSETQDNQAPPAPPAAPSRRTLLIAGGGIVGLLLVAVVAWALLGGGAPASTADAPVAATLYYQAVDNTILALDTTTGVTRTLMSRLAVQTRLLDVSPSGQNVAFIQSTRPVTATVWYEAITETVRIRVPGEAVRGVPFPDPAFHPENARFISEDTLLVQGHISRHQLSRLYLYDVGQGTSRQLADEVDNYYVLPQQGLLLYTREVEGPGTLRPFNSPRVIELNVLDAGGALEPLPLATWSLRESGSPVQVWADPAHNTVFYTVLQNPPGPQGEYWNNLWTPITLMALPVRPLGTPRPVATMTSDALPPLMHLSDSHRYLFWYDARPTPLPGTTPDVSSGGAPPASSRLGELRWDGSVPALRDKALPAELGPGGAFVAGSNLIIELGLVPATRVPTPRVSGGRRPLPVPPTPTQPLALKLQLYDPGNQQTTFLNAGSPLAWLRPGDEAQVGGLLAVGDRLLLAGPIVTPDGTPTRSRTPAPFHLLAGRRDGGGWQLSSLGLLPEARAPEPGRPNAVTFFGLTPDRRAVILGVTQVPTRDTPNGATVDTTVVYRARLDGSGLERLGPAARNNIVFSSK
jgi:hypothetical protein